MEKKQYINKKFQEVIKNIKVFIMEYNCTHIFIMKNNIIKMKFVIKIIIIFTHNLSNYQYYYFKTNMQFFLLFLICKILIIFFNLLLMLYNIYFKKIKKK